MTAPEHGFLPIRPLGPLGVAADSAQGRLWWWLGCHGGAGASTLALALGGRDGGRYWPVADPPGFTNVVLVTRTHASGLRAAQAAARQWASGALPNVRLLGLAVVADAPGRRPKPLRDLLELMSGGLPRVWDLPWVEALRLGDPADQIPLPTSFSAMSADLKYLV